jgi:dTDP-4-amino-4,6-dideoxygalactose transaminase
LIDKRIENVEYLSDKLKGIPGLTPPKTRKDCTHSYYVHAFLYDQNMIGVHRDKFIKAVVAELPETELREGEGAIFSMGYVKPLYLQPLYQNRIAFGADGFPFNQFGNDVDYSKGICPVAEDLYENSFFFHEVMRPPMTKEDLDDIYRAFEKVYEHREELKIAKD